MFRTRKRFSLSVVLSSAILASTLVVAFGRAAGADDLCRGGHATEKAAAQKAFENNCGTAWDDQVRHQCTWVPEPSNGWICHEYAPDGINIASSTPPEISPTAEPESPTKPPVIFAPEKPTPTVDPPVVSAPEQPPTIVDLPVADSPASFVRDEIILDLGRVGRDLRRSDGVIQEQDRIAIATTLVDAYSSNLELLELILSRIDGGQIFLSGPGTESTMWCPSGGTAGGMKLVENYGRSVLIHEAAHLLDCADGSGGSRTDGLPTAMNGDQIDTLIAERQRLTLRYNNEGKAPAPFRSYSFTQPREFWADATMYFFTSDDSRMQMRLFSPQLYQLLQDYYQR